MTISHGQPNAYGVLHLRLREGEYAVSIPREDGLFVLDLDAEGRLLGVKVLDAAGFLAFVREQGGEIDLPDRPSPEELAAELAPMPDALPPRP